MQPSVPVELEMWFLKSEAELIQKEVENAALQQHIQQYEMRLSEYEVKMKFMEGMWQQQVTSLQVNFQTNFLDYLDEVNFLRKGFPL